MALIVGGTTVTGTQTLEASTLTGTASAINGSNITNLPAPSAANVGSGIAGLEPNDVGSFGLIQYNTSGVAVSVGSTTAGSGLRWSNVSGGSVTSPSLSGTWKSTGPALNSANSLQRIVLYYRIS
jgi:hypothetical protein